VPRSALGAEAEIVAALERHGFVWDGPLVRQSQRTPLYEAALADLAARGLIYECACVRRELESTPALDGERVYPGTCRNGVPRSLAHRTQRSLRVKVAEELVSFADRLQGPQRQNLARDVGDFVLKRADGWFAYQLAVVVDDADQAVTSVVRGADLLASTPRQIFLQRALGSATPSYLHVPIAVDRNGHKLSKQTDAPALTGDPVAALLAAWRFLEQSPPLATPRTPAEFWAHAAQAWRVQQLPRVSAKPVV